MSYSGRASEVQDEGNGTSRVTRVYQSDGLGRLISVCEVTSATQLGNGGTPSSCGQDIAATGFLTSYGYDALGNLTSVTQNGLNSRSYSYDGLSRLKTETNPESGTTTYAYDSCSAGDLCTRVRPRANQTNSAVTTTTNYSYDALHRLTAKTYDDGTNNDYYVYDQLAPWGWNIINPKGHLTTNYSQTPSGVDVDAQMFEYDAMGRLIHSGENTLVNWYGTAYHLDYTHDFLGNMLSEANDREGVTYSYAFNEADQLTAFRSSLNTSGHPASLLTVNQYNPLSEVQVETLGNGIVRNLTYDVRGRVTSQTDSSIYSFSVSYAPDSDILTANDSVNGSWTYAYDDFNRLGTSTQVSGSAFNYQYDRFGNRWQQNVSAGSGPTPSYAFNASNQISGSGMTYDAAGNITNDGSHNYSYDAEGRMITVDGGSTATYTYDASGQRVEESLYGGAPIDFIHDVQGHVVTEATASSWDRSELYAGNTHVALYANSTTYFMHTDWLGSTKNQSDMSGNSAQWCSYLPFADGFNCPGSQLDLMNFTGDQWDGETGFSHTLFRQYNPTQGRWMMPDPAGMAAADPANPQSWNRYTYVMNNPLNATDPLGLQSASQNDQCSPNSGQPIGDGNGRQPGKECGTGAIDGSAPHPPKVTTPPVHVFADALDPIETIQADIAMFISLVNSTWRPTSTTPNIPSNGKKLTSAQCQAARTLLQREAKSGTTTAAWQSAIGFGDGTVEPFNSSTANNAYANTALGPVKVDWFTDLRMSSLIPGPQIPAYIGGKLTWTGVRLATGAPITNYLPFQDPVEARTMALAVAGYGFRGLFPPAFMKENCGQ